MKEKITFSFGKNWQDFLKVLTPERLENAKSSIQDFMGMDDLKGKSVIDIGCGSGIFSYAMSTMNPEKLVSFDVDQFSVECCKHMREKAGNPSNWEIKEGSILDDKFVSSLGTFDLVYSWGVLHHTGKMWDAIRKAAELVNKNGYYYIAIYNKLEGMRGSEFWLRIKKFYNAYPLIGRYILEPSYIGLYFFLNLVRLKNPFKSIKNYKVKRGMNWRRDVTDWIGGYPYEYADVEEIFKFMKLNFPDFQLMNIKTPNGISNNWFLFKRI